MLRRKIVDDLKAAGERPTPVKIDKQVMATERSEAALRAIEAVEAAGGTAYYYGLNLLEPAAVAQVLADVLFAPDAPWTLICITERPDLLAEAILSLVDRSSARAEYGTRGRAYVAAVWEKNAVLQKFLQTLQSL